MNTERILIYRDWESLKKAEVNYSEVQRRLQKLLTALRTLKVQPTIQELEAIIFDNEWIDIFEKSKKILESYHLTLDESLENKIIERMNEIQNKQVLSIKKYLSESIVIPDFKYYKIRGRSVVLDPSYKEALEEHFSVYADSEGRKAALEAFYKVQAAVEEFESIVNTAPKRDLTQVEAMIKSGKIVGNQVFPDDLGGLRAVGSKVPSIARLDLDGYLLLDGSAFSNLK